MVRGNRGNHILELKETPFSNREEPLLASKKRPLYLQSAVFTPLSIRRGVGGEAFLHLQTVVFTPLSIRRGDGGEAASLISGVRFLLFNRTVQRNEPYILTMNNS